MRGGNPSVYAKGARRRELSIFYIHPDDSPPGERLKIVRSLAAKAILPRGNLPELPVEN
jgi:hypothetical protein